MRLDFKSLAFGYELENGGGTPAWETALGQGAGYKLKDNSEIDELVKGMVYKAVAPKTISFKKGKGGKTVCGDNEAAGLVISAVFDKVYINEQEIQNGKFILLIAKDDSQSHSGRLKLKYGVDNTYKADDDTIIKNQDFIDLVKEQLNLADNACWFVYDIGVENQDILRLRTIIVNKDNSMTYENSTALHSDWDSRIEDISGCDRFTNEDYKDIFSHNVYGIHIKKVNDALDTERPHICIGWSAMDDLSNLISREEIKNHYMQVYPDASPNTRAQDVGQLDRFVNEAQVGDYVIFAERSVCHIGRIISDYYFDPTVYPNQSKDYANVRNVKWLKTNIKRSNLSIALHRSLGAGMSFWGLNDYKSAVLDLLSETYVKEDIEIENDILTYNELEEEFKKWDSEEVIENRTTRFVAFGFKYAESIKLITGCSSRLIKAIGLDNMGTYIDRGKDLYFIIKNHEIDMPLFDKIEEISYEESVESYGTKSFPKDVNSTRVLGGYNKIFYGAPGCGKSFIINKMLDDANVIDDNRFRVTFHPEYSNCDFVGQILPTVEKKFNETTGVEEEIVKYKVNPGPFTLALERANQTNDMVYLVIEEINRGNAAAIFGDLFQLLDRVNDQSKPNWGESEYPICNVIINDYLRKDKNAKMVIPSNLTIYATMNTSDQNVFTLDTAFKRRWSFEQISNNIEKDVDHKYKGYYVPGTGVTWEKFLTIINKEILKHKITSEDKRMGKYFVSKDCLTETVCDIVDVKVEAEKFAYKVLEYIWNDVCKISKDDWFDTSALLTLEDLIDAFVNPKEDESPLAVFKTISFK